MRYEAVKATLTLEKDKKTGKPRKNWKFTAMSDSMRRHFYGGKLVENLVQATARDVFAEQIVDMEYNRGWCNLFSSHDEAILEVDQSVTAKQVEEAMGKCPEWLKGCPIAAKAKEVVCYLK
jgi:DNA polymerase